MTRSSHSRDDPHHGQPIEVAGAPRQAAKAAVIMVHGRGATARSFLPLMDEFLHHGVMYLAPQAAGSSWYPRSGFGVIEENEPWVSSALARVEAALEIASSAGVPTEGVVLLGFSQGAGIISEYAVRNPRRYGGIVVLSGSLLGPKMSHTFDGSLAGTPVFLGCGSDDPYVPVARMHETASVFAELGGDVTFELYDQLEHAIADGEIQMINTFIERLV